MAQPGELQVDAVVIGMGPGGEEVAGRLAEAGLSVLGPRAGAGRRGAPGFRWRSSAR